MQTRVEKDSLGEFEVPADAYYGVQTQRAVENFPVSSLRFGRRFVAAIGNVKLAACRVNRQLGILDAQLARAIEQAASEVVEGRFDGQFVVDVFQTGSGTSTNMNANEVIANRAIEILGGKLGSKHPVHPNDHVNMSQSSNDVFPTAMHVAAHGAIVEDLIPALEKLREALDAKAKRFAAIVKTGRTHLQDAVPVTLGQEFSAFASMVEHGIRRVERAAEDLAELAIGGTAVGTGINTHPQFAERMVAQISVQTGHHFRRADNLFEALSARDACVAASGAFKTVACSLMKIANDIRLLGSGPRCGIGEIELPAVQPGSSIMPGKVNPVICESVTMVCAQVVGNDATIAIGGMSGHFQLNVFKPVIIHNLLESIELLANASVMFAGKCIDGIKADEERCRELIERSFALVTALNPRIGYDRAAEIAKEAYVTGKTVRQLLKEKQVLPDDEIDAVLDPMKMTRPGL